MRRPDAARWRRRARALLALVAAALLGVAILAGRPPAGEDGKDVLRARQRGYALTVGALQPGALGVAAPIKTSDWASASGSWHTRGLLDALAARGHETSAIPATRLQSEIDDQGEVRVVGPDGVVLEALDLLLVRGLPRGSLEQVIFRVDALHVLSAGGVRCVNSPRALERTIEHAQARSLNRWILPVAVFGSSVTNSIQRGYL